MPLDYATLTDRMDRVEATPAGPARGTALEELVSDLFASVPGARVGPRNTLAASGVDELDLLITNRAVDDGLVGFPYDLLVECKSQADRVSSHAVGWFALQLRRRDVAWGLLVSREGITGDPVTVRAAHREVERAASEGQRILVLIAPEIRCVRSPAHFVALLERKRDAMVAGLKAWVATPEALRDLDPDRGLKLVRGWEAFRTAMQTMRRQRLGEILDKASEIYDLPLEAALTVAQKHLTELGIEAQRHDVDDTYDPLWLVARSVLVDAGAAVTTCLGATPRTDDERRRVSFEVEATAPQRLRAHIGSRLWNLLTTYYLDEISEPELYDRERAVCGFLAMAVEQLISIDDIEPPGAWDDSPA
jgi:hypothetical protein